MYCVYIYIYIYLSLCADKYMSMCANVRARTRARTSAHCMVGSPGQAAGHSHDGGYQHNGGSARLARESKGSSSNSWNDRGTHCTPTAAAAAAAAGSRQPTQYD